MSPFSAGRQRARVLIFALGLGLAYALLPYISGLLGGVVLYVLCIPAHGWLARRIGVRWGAIVVTVVMAVLFLLPGAWLVSVVLSEAPDILRRIQEGQLLGQLQTLRVGPFEVGAQIAKAGGTLVSWISGQALGFFGSATRSILNLFLALFGLYYMLVGGGVLWNRFRVYLPFSDSNSELLRARFHSATEAMVLGILVVALLQGTLIGVGFRLTGLPNAMFWGGITACVSVLPVLGSAIVWVPGMLALLAQHRFSAAAFLAVIGALIASNVDNIFRPLIYRRVSNVHPMITLVGAFAGVSLFGFVGLLLGPLAISYFFELLRMYDEEYGERTTTTANPIPAPSITAPPAP
jgi:predicted PurR-regulated permease PerM